MINYDYQCQGCGSVKDNQHLDSFVCACGGTYRLLDGPLRGESCFEPHYNEVIKDYVHSWKDMEEKGKKFRSKDHPNGFVVTQGNTKFVRELKHDHKHREELIQESYAKAGMKYKPGRNLRLDEKSGNFVRGGGPGYQRKFF